MSNNVLLEKINATIFDFVVVADKSNSNALVPGLTAAAFTIRLWNPAGTLVYERVGASVNTNTVPVTLTEFDATDAPGVYKLSFTATSAGEWSMQIIHATYYPQGLYATYRCYSILYGQTSDASVRQRFAVVNSSLAPVTGLLPGAFTVKLFNPADTEVSGSVTVTIVEVGSGVYEATWDASSSQGKWLLLVKHATYFPYGQYDTYRYELNTTPAAPSITATSVAADIITVTVDGDDGVTNYAVAYDALGALDVTGSRSGDGDITLQVSARSAFYTVIAYSYHPDGNFSAPSAPERVYVSGASESKYAELRKAIRDRLVASTTLSTILGTDKNGNVPIYQASNFGAPSTPRVVSYILRAVREVGGNVSDLRDFEIEFLAEIKTTAAAAPANILDQIEDEIDDLLDNWAYDGTIWWMEFSARDGMSAPTFDAAGQGFEGRTWRWLMKLGEK